VGAVESAGSGITSISDTGVVSATADSVARGLTSNESEGEGSAGSLTLGARGILLGTSEGGAVACIENQVAVVFTCSTTCDLNTSGDGHATSVQGVRTVGSGESAALSSDTRVVETTLHGVAT